MEASKQSNEVLFLEDFLIGEVRELDALRKGLYNNYTETLFVAKGH